jgi:hypothetical protein
MILRALGLASSLLLLAAQPVFAEDEAPKRTPHWLVRGGLWGSLTGDIDWGTAAAAEVLPGGAFQRFGFRAEWRGLEGASPWMALGGVVYEGGSARPGLAMLLYANAGATSEKDAVVGAGGEALLNVAGPLGVSVWIDGHLIAQGIDSPLLLAGGVGLHLGL